MTPKGTPDPEYPTDKLAYGKREDKRNLVDEWISLKKEKVSYVLFSTVEARLDVNLLHS